MGGMIRPVDVVPLQRGGEELELEKLSHGPTCRTTLWHQVFLIRLFAF